MCSSHTIVWCTVQRFDDVRGKDTTVMEARPVLLSPATCLYTHQYPDVHSSYWMAMKILHLLFKLFCISLFVYQVDASAKVLKSESPSIQFLHGERFFAKFCWLLYLKAGKCVDQFLHQDPVSLRFQAAQEDYPRPQICISIERWYYHGFPY